MGDDELRQFFSTNRARLIMKGAKVQNLPRGGEARITAMLNLPEPTESIVQNWFSENLSLIEPENVDEIVETYSLYEDSTESLSENDAKRFARSCLIHLFSDSLSGKLLSFLRSSPDGSGQDSDLEQASEEEPLTVQKNVNRDDSFSDPNLSRALIAVFEGKDPDEYLVNQPQGIANFLSGLYFIKQGESEGTQNSLETLCDLDLNEISNILFEYSKSVAKKKSTSKPAPSGVQIIQLDNLDEPLFDLDRDQIVGKCTKDSPATAVFVQPFAVHSWDGRLLSLEDKEIRRSLFPNSGDVQAFTGKHYPKQPKKHELGIWHIDRNEPGNADHFTNYHLKSTKTLVYELQLVPFNSADYDSVREYIKEQFSQSGLNQTAPYLFQLRDGLILGCPQGKDLVRDDGFDEGMPCWRSLEAFRFEGRLHVLGPLPAHEVYECSTLASTVKKFFKSNKDDPDNLSKAQQRRLLEWINTSEGHQNDSRRARLLEELEYIDNHDGGIDTLLEQAMTHERVKAKIDQEIQKIVELRINEKSELLDELEKIRKQSAELKKANSTQEKHLKALPSSINKAVKESLKKAKEDVLDTLGQVVIYDALINKPENNDKPSQSIDNDQIANSFRSKEHDNELLTNTLKSIGLSSKHAAALERAGQVVLDAGLVLIVEGIAARLIAEAWGSKDKSGCLIFDCGIGVTGGHLFKNDFDSENSSVVILDANLSPLDVYARHLIDLVQQRLAVHEQTKRPSIILSLSDGVAGLPLSKNIEALSVRISLDKKIEYLREEDAQVELEEIQDEDTGGTWGASFWKPALVALLYRLKELPINEAALAISVIKAGVEEGQQDY